MENSKILSVRSDTDGHFPGYPLDINLTREQSTQFQDVRNAFFKDTAGLQSDIIKIKKAMDVLMLEKNLDSAKAEKLKDEISGITAQISRKRIQAQLDARSEAE